MLMRYLPFLLFFGFALLAILPEAEADEGPGPQIGFAGSYDTSGYAEGVAVSGDYVDDRDTIIQDSVVSKSNIGAGSDDKFTKLKELTEMKEKGLIDAAEFKQMKKEILGK
jgi:alkyl hydroperoxide reductase subunit AhpC